ncbi:heat shock protein Hsp-16.48/Hsp-16.49-like [Lytechinus variegatus]|uniref:heat shock protein Hsp-16.48/Hsp-16.49-like n=1 Tax=Lytechinus variegatus TaxID=7654 RepID=UPI001BB28CEF|nr:heat shock protein Hsp-16.48/Hsp-16.49-like [Lytechinus variegatus]
MSHVRFFPTFRLSRRVCQDIHRPAMFGKHWKRMMDHHLGMMEKLYDISDELQSKSGSHRLWSKDANKPFWWNRYEDSQSLTQQSARSFGKISLGEDVSNFEMVVDLGEKFKSDEVDVSIKLVNDRELHVGAAMEKGSTDGGNYQKQNFSNVVLLPQETDVEKLKAILSEDGFLKVEAPMVRSDKSDDIPTREIEIERKSDSTIKSDP